MPEAVFGLPSAKVIWTPRNETGLVFECDARDLPQDGFNTDGAAVSRWRDLSGKGMNAVQSTGSLQPLFKTNILSGLPGVKGDGTDDFLTASGLGALLTNSAGSLFAVATINGDTQYGLCATHNSLDAYWRFASDGGAYWGIFRGARLTNANSMPSSGSYIFCITSGAAGYRFFQNGVTILSTTTSWNAGTDLRLFVEGGNAGYFSGYLHHLLVFDNELSASQLSRVTQYLNSIWKVFVA
mgnify:CR=1 FL=1